MQSQKFASFLLVTLSYGCGAGGAREAPGHDGERAAHQTPVSDDEQTALEDSEGLNLSGAELGDVKNANKSLAKMMAAAAESIETTRSLCIKAAAKRTAVTGALSPIATELAALQAKSSSLDGLVAMKAKGIAAKKAELGALEGELTAAKSALASIGPNYATRMKAIANDVNSSIKRDKTDLKTVEAKIKNIIAALSFDIAGYEAQDLLRDQLEERIELNTAQLSQLKAALANSAAADKKKLESKINELTKKVAAVKPGIKKDISQLNKERSALVREKTDVDAEIGRDKEASELLAAAMPEGCAKLGVVSK